MMSGPGTPNVLFIVWDAARFDYTKEYATHLGELSESSVWFENAFAPSTWSLPSHVSLFTGKPPHEHERYRITDQIIDSVPLVEHFNDRGYSTKGVSGNGFVSPRTGFADPFLSFDYTTDHGPFQEGLNVSKRALELRGGEEGASVSQVAVTTFKEALAHDYPLRSLANFGIVSLHTASRWTPLSRIPKPLFNPYVMYAYAGSNNTKRITSYLEDAEEPFFLFANYMDTHRPYNPPAELLEDDDVDPLPYSEVAALNDYAAPWEFIRQTKIEDNIDTNRIETIRDLYRGEIRSVDQHLATIVESLKENDQFEDTLIVVTSDHGENLGESDLLGNRRMGHEASVSRNLFRVPLAVISPALEPRTVEQVTPIHNVFDLLVGVADGTTLDSSTVVDSLVTDSGVVTVEYPALDGEDIYDRYPDIPDAVLDYRAKIHHVAAVSLDWMTLRDSSGTELAWENGAERAYEEAPKIVRERAEAVLDKLVAQNRDAKKLSQDQVSHLEAMGYI